MKHFDYNNYLKNNPLLKESIEEAKLSPIDQELKNKYIDDYLTLTIDPYAADEVDGIADIDTIEAHAKQFGYEDTLRTIDAKEDPKYAKRGIPVGGFDPLQGKVVGRWMGGDVSAYRREPVITKKGKMHKYDVDLIKNKIKSNLGLNY